MFGWLNRIISSDIYDELDVETKEETNKVLSYYKKEQCSCPQICAHTMRKDSDLLDEEILAVVTPLVTKIINRELMKLKGKGYEQLVLNYKCDKYIFDSNLSNGVTDAFSIKWQSYHRRLIYRFIRYYKIETDSTKINTLIDKAIGNYCAYRFLSIEELDYRSGSVLISW